MPLAPIPHVEIESLPEFDLRILRTASIRGWILRSLDLREREAELGRVRVAGALFLGCLFSGRCEDDLRDRGALIFPTLPSVPFDPYRGNLYRALELYDSLAAGGQYDSSLDATVYAWSTGQPTPPPVDTSLAMNLHDHAVTDALDDVLKDWAPERVVGVMGGHAIARTSDDYIGAARLGSRLAAGRRLVVTGGGPGAMEATNLGARLAGQPAILVHALETLAAVPVYNGDITAWAAVALEVAQNDPVCAPSLGIPTWFYGHEPPNVFATGIAKYFSNAIREDILLSRCGGGVVYLPGAAGTVQEIFQAATQHYYAPEGADLGPLVLVGVRHWTEQLPAWPLLAALGRDRAMAERIILVDEVDQAADILLDC